MPVSTEHWVYENVKFGVSSYDIGTKSPVITIPLKAFDVMTDTQIGECARALIAEAQFMRALEIADCLGVNNIPDEYASKHPNKVRLLEAFCERSLKIAQTLEAIKKGHERYIRRLARLEKKMAGIPTDEELVRRQLQAQYDRTFIKIGRRDGFCCQQCSTSSDLEIDHIVAVTNGGTNDLDNLQLLCKTCNGKKSNKG